MRLPLEIRNLLSKPDIPGYNPQPMWNTEYSHVVLIILDGISQLTFRDLNLPNLNRVTAGGTSFTNCLTTFPTITGSAHTSIHTGCYQETHKYGFPVVAHGGVPRAAINGDLAFQGYISDSLKAHGMSSAAISDGTLRNAFYSLYAEGFTGHSITGAADAAINAFKEFKPNYLTVTFYATDTLSHRYGPDHEYVEMALEEIDEQIGRIMDTIGSMNLEDKTVTIVTADHGFARAEKTVNALVEPLIRQGLVVAPNLRSLVTPSYPHELLEALGDEVVDRVLSPIELKLLGFQGDGQNYVVCLKEGFAWEYDRPYRGNHGGFTRKERNVPLVFYGSGIPSQRLDQLIDTVDIAPTIAGLLGGKMLDSFQGRPLAEILGKEMSERASSLTKWREEREQRLHTQQVLGGCHLT